MTYISASRKLPAQNGGHTYSILCMVPECGTAAPTLYAWRMVDYQKWTNRPNPDDYELRP